ncbi:MAG: CRISPR-associated protein Cas4 [Bacteroidota bacterium]
MNATVLAYGRICPRKAWLHYHGVRMEHESEAVQIGRLIDEQSYASEKKGIDLQAELPDGTVLTGKVDWANFREGILHETKKGKACQEAHVWQVRFYLWLLQLCEVTQLDGSPYTGMISYPRLKQKVPVELSEADEQALIAQVQSLKTLLAAETPPDRITRRSFCKKCAFEELCYG